MVILDNDLFSIFIKISFYILLYVYFCPLSTISVISNRSLINHKCPLKRTKFFLKKNQGKELILMENQMNCCGELTQSPHLKNLIQTLKMELGFFTMLFFWGLESGGEAGNDLQALY